MSDRGEVHGWVGGGGGVLHRRIYGSSKHVINLQREHKVIRDLYRLSYICFDYSYSECIPSIYIWANNYKVYLGCS